MGIVITIDLDDVVNCTWVDFVLLKAAVSGCYLYIMFLLILFWKDREFREVMQVCIRLCKVHFKDFKGFIGFITGLDFTHVPVICRLDVKRSITKTPYFGNM